MPHSALEWVVSLPPFEGKEFLIKYSVAHWASTALHEAERWVRSQPKGEQQASLMTSLIDGVSDHSPREGLRLARELPKSYETERLIIRGVGDLVCQDRQAALSYAQEVKNVSLRQEIMEQVASLTAFQDPRAAADIAIRDMLPGVQQDRALVMVVQLWVQKEPEIAAAWVNNEFPQDHLGQAAAETVVNLWAQKDFSAAGRWLSSLPPGKIRNSGLLAYSNIAMRTDSKLADKWLAMLTTEP